MTGKKGVACRCLRETMRGQEPKRRLEGTLVGGAESKRLEEKRGVATRAVCLWDAAVEDFLLTTVTCDGKREATLRGPPPL